MKPHKHAELIKAWADGAEIEVLDKGIWYWASSPQWYPEWQYRIKPEPKPDVPEGLIDPKSYYQGFEDGKNSVLKPEPKPDVAMYYIFDGSSKLIGCNNYGANLRIICDGETGELKSAEVIK